LSPGALSLSEEPSRRKPSLPGPLFAADALLGVLILLVFPAALAQSAPPSGQGLVDSDDGAEPPAAVATEPCRRW
jgi:hypothetical protein